MPSPQATLSFSQLPLEIRRKIWFYALPGPRVLQVLRKSSSSSRPFRTWFRRQTTYTVNPASYGGHQITLLSINHESRTEALRYLTPLWNTYWNLLLDFPYFEIKSNDDDGVTLVTELRKKGELERFRRIAFDMMLWRWAAATASMEFRVTFRGKFDEYEHPIETLKGLPKIETAYVILTQHTLQKDLVKPYTPWRLGSLTPEACLMETVPGMEEAQLLSIEERYEFGDRELDMKPMAIHDREREYLPPNKLYKPLEGWQMDWFG